MARKSRRISRSYLSDAGERRAYFGRRTSVLAGPNSWRKLVRRDHKVSTDYFLWACPPVGSLLFEDASTTAESYREQQSANVASWHAGFSREKAGRSAGLAAH
jgi:hypothetical protein